MEQGSIRLNHSKNAVIRSVPMHPRVMDVLRPIWEKRGQPTKGHVFLNRLGKPYSDTRKAKIPGGNPIKNQHATACRCAAIEEFTVNDRSEERRVGKEWVSQSRSRWVPD